MEGVGFELGVPCSGDPRGIRVHERDGLLTILTIIPLLPISRHFPCWGGKLRVHLRRVYLTARITFYWFLSLERSFDEMP